MSASLQELEHAVQSLQARPQSIGPLLRLLRLCAASGAATLARSTAKAFAHRLGGAARSDAALIAFAAQAPARVFEHGERIVQEGDTSDSVFVVIRGEASVWRAGTGQIATLGPGDCFGEIALLGHTTRTASVMARGETEVLEIPRRALDELTQFCPPVMDDLHSDYRERVLDQIIPADSVFSTLDHTARWALFRHFVPCSVKAGTKVLREQQPGAGFCVIVSGRAVVWRKDIHGVAQTVAELRPGEFFGEISLLFDCPVTATVEAATPLTFYGLKRADFLMFLRSNPMPGQRLLQVASQRLGYEPGQGLSDEHPMVTGPVPVVASTFGGQRCPSCDYPDAGVICPACGSDVD